MKFWLLMVGIDLINPLTMIALRKTFDKAGHRR